MTADEVAVMLGVLLDTHGGKSVEIRRASSTLDAYGHPDGSTLVATVTAVVLPVSGTESWRAKQRQGVTSWIIISEYVAGVTTSDWLVVGDRKLWITSVIDVSDVGQMLQLTCAENKAEP